jgi:hypothetical protein
MKLNGTLKVALTKSEHVNEYGEIVSSLQEWSKPIDCCISTNSDNRIGKYEDGEFRMSAYTILLEASGAFYEALAHEDSTLVENGSDGGLIGAERQMPVIDRVSLSRYGESLGEFRVQSMEAFPSVGRIQLSVV